MHTAHLQWYSLYQSIFWDDLKEYLIYSMCAKQMIG